jgi:hypothetical protein
MQLTVKYGDKVLFDKEVILSDKQQARVTDRIALAVMTNDERVAQAQAQAAIVEAQMTPIQKSERALFLAMSPEDRQIVMLAAQRDAADSQLNNLVK